MKLDSQTQKEIGKHVDQALKKINWGKEALNEVEKLRRDFEKRIAKLERDTRYTEQVTGQVDTALNNMIIKNEQTIKKLEKRIATLEKRK